MADHNDDPSLIHNWTANKTAANVSTWVNKSTLYCVTAIDEDEQVVGFSMMRNDGGILLLYVAPDAVRCGAGKGLLESLESFAKSAGIIELHLLSSKTAREFYIRYGFSETGQPKNLRDGMPGYPMTKPVDIDAVLSS